MGSFHKYIGIAGGERNMQLKKIGEVTMSSSRRIWNWSNFINLASARFICLSLEPPGDSSYCPVQTTEVKFGLKFAEGFHVEVHL